MQKFTSPNIKKYLIDNYGQCRHEPMKMKRASVKTARFFNVNPIDVFLFMVEKKDIPGMYCVSYNFHTAQGREVANLFSSFYNN